VTSGRLAPEKRLIFLLRIFIELKKKKPNVRFLFIGDGPELNALLKICESANLRASQGSFDGETPDVIFVGNQRNVFKYLRGASLYLLNSSSEGFPNGMVEAMICDVPVMSSDCPYGPREILAPELNVIQLDRAIVNSRGILMPLDNSDDHLETWVRAIILVLEDTDLRTRLSQGGSERICEFDKEKIISQWLSVITPSN
jgi:glycosyltransferase involved in cell wall biosynthesis